MGHPEHPANPRLDTQDVGHPAFENPFEETATVLVVITPGVFGAPYFREMRELMAAGWPPDPKMAAEVMMRHGLVPVRPSAG